MFGSPINITVFKYNRNNKSVLNGIYLFMVFKINLQIIDLGVFNPKYLNIIDYEKDWEIFANKVFSLLRFHKSFNHV